MEKPIVRPSVVELASAMAQRPGDFALLRGSEKTFDSLSDMLGSTVAALLQHVQHELWHYLALQGHRGSQ